MSESLQAACEAVILGYAAPFKSISEEGRAHLATWLNNPPAGHDATRLEMCEADPDLRDALLIDMQFIGAHALRFALARQERQAVRGERPSFSLEFSDLEMARFVVSAKSTILCPDNPNGG